MDQPSPENSQPFVLQSSLQELTVPHCLIQHFFHYLVVMEVFFAHHFQRNWKSDMHFRKLNQMIRCLAVWSQLIHLNRHKTSIYLARSQTHFYLPFGHVRSSTHKFLRSSPLQDYRYRNQPRFLHLLLKVLDSQ